MTDFSTNLTVLDNLLAIGKANVTTNFYLSYYSQNFTSASNDSIANQTVQADLNQTDSSFLNRSNSSEFKNTTLTTNITDSKQNCSKVAAGNFTFSNETQLFNWLLQLKNGTISLNKTVDTWITEI